MNSTTLEAALEQAGLAVEVDALSVYRALDAQQVTGEKQNELSTVLAFLTPALVKGRIISADARPTQHAFVAVSPGFDGDSVLIAKDNQPTLADDLRLFFTGPPADCLDWRTARKVDKGHGLKWWPGPNSSSFWQDHGRAPLRCFA